MKNLLESIKKTFSEPSFVAPPTIEEQKLLTRIWGCLASQEYKRKPYVCAADLSQKIGFVFDDLALVTNNIGGDEYLIGKVNDVGIMREHLNVSPGMSKQLKEISVLAEDIYQQGRAAGELSNEYLNPEEIALLCFVRREMSQKKAEIYSGPDNTTVFQFGDIGLKTSGTISPRISVVTFGAPGETRETPIDSLIGKRVAKAVRAEAEQLSKTIELPKAKSLGMAM